MAKDVRTADDMAHALGIPTAAGGYLRRIVGGRRAGSGREGESHGIAPVYGEARRVSMRGLVCPAALQQAK